MEKIMFKVGDLVVYSNNGVCEVTDIGKLDSACAPKDKIYYTIEPYYSTGTKIYTPVDNDKVIMRAVATKKEALTLIDNIKNIETLGIADDKRRETDYRETIKKCDCNELVKIIKSIYVRNKSRIAEGKKIASSDEKYFKIAEDNLYGELAIPLDMDREEVKQFVIDRVEQM